MKDKPYRQCIGDLLWLSRVYRYDLQYSVNACARVANNPGPKHWQALCKILRYLNHTREYRLVFRKPEASQPHVTGYTDSDWAPNYGTYFDNYRSTSGSIISHNKHALVWKSRRQDRVAQSSTEAEYYAAADTAKYLTFVSRIIKSISPNTRKNVPSPVLHIDNKSAIHAAQNAQDNEKQRHIDIRAHFLRDLVTRKSLHFQFISGLENPADAQTKPLGDVKFGAYRNFHSLLPPTLSVRQTMSG